jgi:hypothetical protein
MDARAVDPTGVPVEIFFANEDLRAENGKHGAGKDHVDARVPILLGPPRGPPGKPLAGRCQSTPQTSEGRAGAPAARRKRRGFGSIGKRARRAPRARQRAIPARSASRPPKAAGRMKRATRVRAALCKLPEPSSWFSSGSATPHRGSDPGAARRRKRAALRVQRPSARSTAPSRPHKASAASAWPG